MAGFLRFLDYGHYPRVALFGLYVGSGPGGAKVWMKPWNEDDEDLVCMDGRNHIGKTRTTQPKADESLIDMCQKSEAQDAKRLPE